MTEVLLLLLALLLTLACAVFVAAEFSLTTVERGELERAAAAGERGAESALRAVRRLTLQLSGAQLGITVTSLVIGMLAEPSLAALLRGPFHIEATDFHAGERRLRKRLGEHLPVVIDRLKDAERLELVVEEVIAAAPRDGRGLRKAPEPVRHVEVPTTSIVLNLGGSS